MSSAWKLSLEAIRGWPKRQRSHPLSNIAECVHVYAIITFNVYGSAIAFKADNGLFWDSFRHALPHMFEFYKDSYCSLVHTDARWIELQKNYNAWDRQLTTEVKHSKALAQHSDTRLSLTTILGKQTVSENFQIQKLLLCCGISLIHVHTCTHKIQLP